MTPGTWHGHVYGRADADIHGRVVGASGAIHAGENIKEPSREGAARARMGGPVAPNRPAQQNRGEPNRTVEPTRPAPAVEPQRAAPEPEHKAEVKREPEQTREPEHGTEVKPEPEHRAPRKPTPER